MTKSGSSDSTPDTSSTNGQRFVSSFQTSPPGPRPFVELVSGVLSDDPLFVIINSYTTGLSPSVLTYLSESIFTRRFGGHSESQELGLPVAASGLVLPCGAACRWER